MMTVKVTYSSKDGRSHRYKWKNPDELSGISRKKKAIFIFDFRVLEGYADGEIDSESCFSIWKRPEAPSWGWSCPVNKLLGWAYLRDKERRKESGDRVQA